MNSITAGANAVSEIVVREESDVYRLIYQALFNAGLVF
jgi:phage-related protein